MKPIAKLGDYPFAVNGISVFAATDKDAQLITDDLFVVNERSTRVFDLINADEDNIYTFKSMVYRDKTQKPLPLNATTVELQALLGKNQFVVKLYDLDSGDVLGYVYKFFTHKFILADGSEVPVVDFSAQTSVPVPPVVSVTSVSLTPATVSLSLAGTTTQALTADVLPVDATNKQVTYSTSDPLIATVSTTGVVTAVAVGSATITVTTVDGAKTDTTAVTVTA